MMVSIDASVCVSYTTASACVGVLIWCRPFFFRSTYSFQPHA